MSQAPIPIQSLLGDNITLTQITEKSADKKVTRWMLQADKEM